ncbi:hypothetical protein SK128_006877 [Halocaridina rubra]|uniref:C3H1-type domain-containing protein n=1 Tax=Halocaridina rubra TaxID=373956 RepID=A0AAN8ZYC8_HALRR
MAETEVNPPEEKGEMEEEKEEGELEEGELEDDDEGEKEGELVDSSGASPVKDDVEENDGNEKTEAKEITKEGVTTSTKEEGSKKDKKESKEEKKRKHRDDDEEKERKKKKKKRKHASSDEEENEIVAGPPKFHHRRGGIPHPYGDEIGFDAMLQQEMFLRGHSPTPGMAYGIPGPFGVRHPGMFRGDYDSYDSGSDSEMHMDHRRRRRHRRSRSRSRSPSRKNEAICLYFMNGSCQRGKSCSYSHDIQPQRKMELCKFYMMDCCAKREKCLYMHKDFPCKNYHTGIKCVSADKCKFSHETMSEATRNILLKHIELAPKDILGDFPRLTKEAAQMVVSITEAHRGGKPLDVENMPGIMELRGRNFKYVEKAIKNVIKRREERAKAAYEHGDEIEEGPSPEKRGRYAGKSGDRTRHHDDTRHEHNLPYKHRNEGPRIMPENVDSLVKALRNQSYDKGRRQQADDWHKLTDHNRGDWMGNQRDSPNSMPYSNSINGELPRKKGSPTMGNMQDSSHSPTSRNRHPSSDQSCANTPQNISPGKKLGGIMACMPQKQRDFFQRIQQQHSVHEDDEVPMDSNIEESSAGASNVNWYSSDEEGDGSSSTRQMWQNQNSSQNTIHSPSRTPPGSRTPMYNEQMSPTDRRHELDNSNDGSGNHPTPKIPFSKINFANININSSDLAIVLSAVKNQAAANANKSIQSDTSRDPRMNTSSRDPRDIHDSGLDMLRDSPRYQEQRDDMPNQRSNISNSNSWGKNSWGSDRSVNDSKDARGMRDNFTVLRSPDPEQQQRNSDTDLRVLPRAESGRRDSNSGAKNVRYDTDMRMTNETSIYDVDLRQLDIQKTPSGMDEDLTSLPFKVPVHTPCKEIVASITSHPPLYYHLVKVLVPKPDFSHLKINKDDPKILEDPRLRRMLRKNSTEDSINKSPRAPSRYELDGPLSPPPSGSNSRLDQPKFSDIDSRDPRVPVSRDPRSDTRGDHRTDMRGEPRGDPRTSTRVDPRIGSRSDPRTEFRDPVNDIRNQDPRMSGMYGGGNNGNMMEGGIPYQNMGHGPGPPGHGAGPGPGPGQRVDPRGRPGLLGPAPSVPHSGNVPNPNMGPGMPPYMMGSQMGPNMGYFPDDSADMMGGVGNFPPPGGQKWGGPLPSNDPRLHRDMGDGLSSYTPPPVS